MSTSAGFSLLELLLALTIFAIATAVLLPRLTTKMKRPNPEIVEFLERERAAAIEAGRVTTVSLTGATLSGSNGEHIDLAKGVRLTPTWPKPSVYLAHQLVATFYPDGTSIASEFDLDNPDQGEFHGERFHISITPMQGEIIHVPR
jgi:prepilin-type N-terminal cleavage/methylation domain-containing protein